MNFIYATNTAQQAVNSGGTVQVGTVTRRYGDISLNNSAVDIQDCGWYEVTAQVTFTSTAGQANVSVFQDGQQVTGAVVGITADASTAYTLNVQAVVRKTGCKCVPSAITVVNSGATTLTVSNASVIVEKI